MALTALIRGGIAPQGLAWRRKCTDKPSNGKAGSGYEPQRHCLDRPSKGYEVNCCAVALRSTDGQGKGEAKMGREWRSYGMVEQRVERQSEGMAWWSSESKGRAKEWQRKALM